MKRIIIALSLLAAPVAAQTASPTLTQEQLAAGFREEILARFQDAANVRAQLIAAQARIAALEAAAKPAPKPDAPATTPAPSAANPANEAAPSP